MSTMIWDEETQQWVKEEELRLRKIKKEIIDEIVKTLAQDVQIEIVMEDGKKGKGEFKDKDKGKGK